MFDRFQTERVRDAVRPVLDLISLGPTPHASLAQPLTPAPATPPKRVVTPSGIPAGYWAVREGSEGGGGGTRRRDAAHAPKRGGGEGVQGQDATPGGHWSAPQTHAPPRADTLAPSRWSTPRLEASSSPAPFPVSSPGAGRVHGGDGATSRTSSGRRQEEVAWQGQGEAGKPESAAEEVPEQLVWSIMRGGFRCADDSPGWAGISLI